MEVRNRPPNTVTDVYERVFESSADGAEAGAGGGRAGKTRDRFGNFARHVTELRGASNCVR